MSFILVVDYFSGRPRHPTITILIALNALNGSFAPLLAGSDRANVVAEEAIRVQVFVHFFAFIATALLWMPFMRTWIKER